MSNSMPMGDFAGSERIQFDLHRHPDVRWARLMGVSEPDGAVRLRLQTVPPVELTLPLLELTRPNGLMHYCLASDPAAHLEYARACAQALIDTECAIPVLVSRDAHGLRVSRDERVVSLYRGGALRFTFERSPPLLREHLDKHFHGADADELVASFDRGRLRGFPLSRMTLKQVARYPMSPAHERLITGGLGPHHWPAIEAYVAIGLQCLLEMQRSAVTHLARDKRDGVPAFKNTFKALELRRGDESVRVRLPGGLVAVSRDPGGHLRLAWRTLFANNKDKRETERDRQEHIARIAASIPALNFVMHPEIS